MTSETDLKTPGAHAELSALLAERILLLDGAMGTQLQLHYLNEADYRGERFRDHSQHLQGNNDLLNLTRPDLVSGIHQAYLDAGADIISTNTFNANAISLADYGIAGLTHELNRTGAMLARAAVDTYKTPDRPMFVAGVLGPTNRTASISPDVSNPALRNVDFMELADAYTTAIDGLTEGGVDILLLETIFDTLNAKAALYAIERWFEDHGRRVPVMISGTITDAAGRTLSGQTPTAFWYSLRHIRPLSIGLNCALGPKELRPYIEELAEIADTHVSAHPNAGLPDAFGRYLETPEDMARHLGEWARDSLVNIVGGCCGTTPGHLHAVAAAINGVKPRRIPTLEVHCRLSGLEPLVIRPEVNFINIGERTNVAGSPRFLQLIREQNFEAALHIARQQVENGAQIIDICMDESLLDNRVVMRDFLNLIAGEPDISRVPIMIDSSSWEVIETGLRCVQGKGIVNSISLKEGEEKFLELARRIRRYGAAVVVMAFDEEGQAVTTERRFAICRRSYRLLTEQAGFPPEDIIFDPNILTVATGMTEHNDYAVSFFETVRLIKQQLPHALVSGGLSNVSFSFRGNNPVREAMHSAFLYHGIKAGMNMAIVNAGQLGIYDNISPPLLERIEDVLLNRRPDATDRLVEFAESFRNAEAGEATTGASRTDLDVMQRIRLALIKGLDEHIECDIREALGVLGSPLQVIEGPLMAGMSEVGEKFGAGKMFLPQVVKSARVMKKGVACLLPSLEEERRQTGKSGSSNGRIILATVKGDVHDIGKNIVSVVLQCNNFEIIDLGVMAPADRILRAAEEHNADMIALSGLITPSLDEMAHVAAEMQRLGLNLPLLVGGATTSPAHTAIKIASAYDGPVVHIRDASRAAVVAQQLTNPVARKEFLQSVRTAYEKLRQEHLLKPRKADLLSLEEARNNRWRPSDSKTYKPPVPQHFGIRVFRDFPLAELIPQIEWTPFFNAWGLTGKYPDILTKDSSAAEAKRLFADAQILLEKIVAESWLEARAVVGLFPANSIMDDIELYADENRGEVLLRLHSLRQQAARPAGQANLALADFVAPRESGVRDYVGAFALSTGFGALPIVDRLEREHDDYQAIMLRALADRLAEAFSEVLHAEVRRKLWGHVGNGIRPAPGYPTNPDHTEKLLLWDLLDAEKNTGITLTENLAMCPAASVCGLYFSHPDARYFGIGKILRDQVRDYAGRKGMELGAMEKWLGPNLAYDPSAC